MAIERLAVPPSDVEGRDPFQFRITWTEDQPLDDRVRLRWTELPLAAAETFRVTWTEDGLEALFRVTWREEPEDLEDAYDRDPQLIFARMSTNEEG